MHHVLDYTSLSTNATTAVVYERILQLQQKRGLHFRTKVASNTPTQRTCSKQPSNSVTSTEGVMATSVSLAPTAAARPWMVLVFPDPRWPTTRAGQLIATHLNIRNSTTKRGKKIRGDCVTRGWPLRVPGGYPGNFGRLFLFQWQYERR